ncbi:conserved hypothetical protein [Paenibacillus curdlanolyticus YK9]|uniref:Uncharacterized protein n=1 Tax=Paenibacillus curdlanolyticus YK9 TaxID=717606 RepID=E0I4L1_9BACL|nr:hypothetical protein [Paenibacillus curdlanolyticus]EFM12542.1 conserved hypothetical protein [Paenibacillus curdlanolyticus YK9]
MDISVQEIKDFVLEYNLEERTISGFWNYFNNYQTECEGEFLCDFPDYSSDEVELYIDSIALRITNWPDDGYNHVVVALRMHYKEQYAGIYKMTYTLNGEIEDDQLSLI